MRVWKIVIVPFLVMAVAFMTACNPFASGQGGEIVKAEVVRGDLIVKVNGSGKTAVSTDARLAFGTGGKIEKLTVKKGDCVTRGMLLARLETDTLELAVLQAETAEAQARVAESQAQTAVSQTRVAVSQAEAALETARFDRDRMKEVDDIRKKITEAENRITVFEEGFKRSAQGNDPIANLYWKTQLLSAQKDKLDAQKELADLLGTERFKSLRVTSTTLTEASIKQRQVEVAEQSVEQARLAVEQARLTVEQTKKTLEQTKKAVEVAKKQLKEATITSPVNGVVATLDLKEGDVIPPPTLTTTPVIYLIDPSTMELKIDVDEIDIPSIKVNQRAIISLDALPDVKLEGRVTSMGLLPTVVSGVVVYEVKAAFVVPPTIELRVGMSATVDIVVNEHKNVLLVPSRAIKQNSENKPFVEVVVNRLVEERSISIGLSDGVQTEVLSGLKEGDTVVTGRTREK